MSCDPKKPNSARALQEADVEGYDIVFPADNELQIDIDSDEEFQVYERLINVVRDHIGVLDEHIAPSRSGLPKRHITVTLNATVSVIERIALQACLGSDRMREILGYVQYLIKDPHPTLFLENKQKQLEHREPLLLTEGVGGPVIGQVDVEEIFPGI
jgi:hypothetical protein